VQHLVLLSLLIDDGAPWHQSASMNNNKRAKTYTQHHSCVKQALPPQIQPVDSVF